jgi:hypothetical protein
MRRIEGTCHCGNVTVALETSREPRELRLRACACTFCRRHGAKTTADPQGRARIGARDPTLVSRYAFGLRTAEMLVCSRCGVYCAAVLREGDAAWAVINTNLFLDPAFDRHAEAVSYEGETEEERIARRKRMWTPLLGSL